MLLCVLCCGSAPLRLNADPPTSTSAALVTATGTATLTNKTISLGSNTVTLTLPDSGSVSETLAAILAGTAVTPQQFGAIGDGSHDDTAAIQAALDTGRAVYAPEAIYKITAALLKRGIGQWFLGAGINRTIDSQVTNNTDGIDLRDPNGDGVAARTNGAAPTTAATESTSRRSGK